MSGDALCVGVCMIDWDTGVCLGCGRTAEEIEGVPVAPSAGSTAPAGGPAPLPANVAARVGEGSD
ncbi:DUF1289 domain-containing protein [Thauera chlorobenzoica]|uniref:Uncharacterized protein n=1 Tax=Thauera chlorobenzoica TaxID=96773 RepID=A0A1H5WIU5_9RHOO|nr:DUF1289 domain-containing protein [Thauera chlorobenzoica]APR04428.1 hypothetical protein Tchl_1569 [Thauera chlorobenzoica]SEF99263.1 hypothetical protein SAMN05216242_11223 [Thauera chlorobenzoica]